MDRRETQGRTVGRVCLTAVLAGICSLSCRPQPVPPVPPDPDPESKSEPAGEDTSGSATPPSTRFFWATKDGEYLRAQVLSFDDEELWAKLDEADMGPVDPGADCIPEYFQVGDEYQVASATGVHAATLTGFEVDVGPFEGDPILMLVLTPRDPLDEGGLVVRADGPRLTPLRPMDRQNDLAADYLEAYRDLADELSYEDGDLETGRLEVIPGRFPPPHEVLVNATWTVREPSMFGEIGAALLFGHQGHLVDFPEFARRTSQHYETFSIVDIGDDGTDDFLVEYCDNYETSNIMLVLQVWQGDELTEMYLHEGGARLPSWGGRP